MLMMEDSDTFFTEYFNKFGKNSSVIVGVNEFLSSSHKLTKLFLDNHNYEIAA